MDQHLEDLYEEQERLTYQQIDKLVEKYKKSKSSKDKQVLRNEIIRSFHKYIMKYVSLLKGQIQSDGFAQQDTKPFLSLFVSKKRYHSVAPGPGAFKNVTRQLIQVCKSYNECELYNEFAIIFLDLLEKYKKVNKVSFTFYITKYMRWGIKDWLNSRMSKDIDDNIISGFTSLENVPAIDNTDDWAVLLPEFSLAWIDKPEPGIFDKISRYERYLLYLHYAQSMSIIKIGKIVGSNKDTVNKKINNILSKLRNIYLEE